jgi:hypothetical protein
MKDMIINIFIRLIGSILIESQIFKTLEHVVIYRDDINAS